MGVMKGTIEVEEFTDYEMQFAEAAPIETRRYWIASITGTVGKTEVTMQRSAQHAGEAIALLRQAIKDEGWLLMEER